jgi:hypothetical protein
MTSPDVAAFPNLEVLGAALGQRVRHVAAAVRRLDGLDAGRNGPEASQPVAADIREFVLRALRIAADRDSDAMLRAVAAGTGDTVELAQLTGRPRLALWETVGDLVQAGLLERDPLSDGARLTRAGAAMLALVDELVAAGEEP